MLLSVTLPACGSRSHSRPVATAAAAGPAGAAGRGAICGIAGRSRKMRWRWIKQQRTEVIIVGLVCVFLGLYYVLLARVLVLDNFVYVCLFFVVRQHGNNF